MDQYRGNSSAGRARLTDYALLHGGFRGVDNAWWHFEMLDRQQVRQYFTRVD